MQPIEASPAREAALSGSVDVHAESSTYSRLLNAARHAAAWIPVALGALLLCIALPVAAQDSQPPSVPTGLTGTAVSTTKINLSWNASTDNVGVSGYYVYLNDEAIATTSGTTFQHLGRTPGTTYNYRVSAYDAAFNHSGWTATPVSVTTGGGSPDTTAPTVPTGLTATAVSSTQVNLTWNAAADNYGVKGYYVYLNDQALRTTKSTSFQHTGLSPGTTYNYRVSAYDDIPNHSGWSASAVSVTTPSSDSTSPIATFTSTTAEIPNPERGFTKLVTNLTGLGSWWLTPRRDEGYRLVTHRELLSDYKSGPFPQNFLDALDNGAALHRSTGTKMVMQFSYDNDGNGSDPNLPIIQGHIAQLKPFFRKNADVIAAVHAGFLGTYGEWAYTHNPTLSDPGTQHATAATRVAIRDALYAAVDRSTPIAFRTLDDLQGPGWYPYPLTDLQSFTEDGQARAGIQNDCFLSSLDDSGTYWRQTGNNNSGDLSNPLRLYHSTTSEWTSTGGELCDDVPAPYWQCSYVKTDGPRYHWRYLRDDRHPGLHGDDLEDTHIYGYGQLPSPQKSWQEQVPSCLAEVKRSLGYRFQLDAISHPATVSRGGIVNVVVDLKNAGWSRIFSARKLVVLFRNRTTGTWVTAGAGDMRSLPSQASASTRVVVSVPIPVDASAAGIHDVFLSMPDIWPGTKDNQYHAVRFANADNSGAGQVWEQTNFRFQTGTSLTVTSSVAADVTPPAVNITAPAPGNTVSGSMVVTASASDNFGVVGVTFYYKSVSGATTQFGQGEDLAAPYNASADTTLVSNGTYTLTAVARDAAGNTTTSAPVIITVSN